MAEELYLTSSTGEELQFCFMRPSAEELCPELPFMIAGLPITLDSFGVSARLLSVDDFPPLPPISDDAPPSSTRPAMSASAAAEALERALTSGEPLVSLGELPAGDWRDLFQLPRVESALAAASAMQLQQLAVAAGNETLADLLLHHTLPRLLGRAVASQPHQPPQPQEARGHEPAALPPEMAELLTALLHAGSLRRCAPADFDASVLRCLCAAPAPAPPLHRPCAAVAPPLHRPCAAVAPPLHRPCAAVAPPLQGRPQNGVAQPLHSLCTLSAGTPAPALASAAREGGSDAGVVLLRGCEAG